MKFTPEESMLSETLKTHIVRELEQSGGWLPFDRFMALALYTPGLGYYSNDTVKLGLMPSGGSDFVTAPELSPWFGRALARQLAQALQATHTHDIWEFGAGSGALARQMLEALTSSSELGQTIRYHIVDVSGSLRERQRETLKDFQEQVVWEDRLPDRFEGVVVGNEVLDAMPVRLLHRMGGAWFERGVTYQPAQGVFAWEDRPTDQRPPTEMDGDHDYLTEWHEQAEAFVRTLAERWTQGVAFFLDYGFPEAEYYHPQRSMGTLICHRAHRADDDPLSDVGLKDITAHVNFTGIALAAQEAGLHVLGYTSQGRFLINAGLVEMAADAPLPERVALAKLINEHEMGELFKVICLGASAMVPDWTPLGFTQGDRTHRL